jgi:hypothetical protein
MREIGKSESQAQEKLSLGLVFVKLATMVLLANLLDGPDFAAGVQALAQGFRIKFGLPALHQLGIVVPGVEPAAAQLEGRGIGPFLILAGPTRLWREREVDRNFSGKLGIAYHQGFELELLEPGQGSDFYRQSLDPEGRMVVQHLGFLAPEVDAAAERLVAAGHPLWVRGQIKTGPMRADFAYLDTIAAAGLIIEFISMRIFGRVVRPRPGLIHALGRLQKRSGRRSLSV